MLKSRKIFIYFGISILAIIIIGCEALDNPNSVNIDDVKIKTEIKWKVDKNTEEKINKVYYKEFDKYGNILLNLDYFSNGEVNCKSEYEYTNRFNGLETKTVFDNSGNVIDEFKTEYILNKNGNIDKEIKYSDNGNIDKVINYFYDDMGNLVRKTNSHPDEDSSKTIEYSYSYNDVGNVVERIVNDLSFPNSVTRDSVIYLPNNNNIQVINYEDNILNSVTSYIYNDLGQIKKEIITDKNGDIINKYIYEYTYY